MDNRIRNPGEDPSINDNGYKGPQMHFEEVRLSPEPRGISSMSQRPRNTARVFSDLSEAHSSIMSKANRSDNGSAPPSDHSDSPEPMTSHTKAQLGPLPLLRTREKYHLHPNVLFRTPDESLKIAARGGRIAEEPSITQQVTPVDTNFQETGQRYGQEDKQAYVEGYMDQPRFENSNVATLYSNTEQVGSRKFTVQVLSEHLDRFNPPKSIRFDRKDTGSASLEDSAESSTVEKIISGYGDGEGVTDIELSSMTASHYGILANSLKMQQGKRIVDRSAGSPPTQNLPPMFESQMMQSPSGKHGEVSYNENDKQLFSLTRTAEHHGGNLENYISESGLTQNSRLPSRERMMSSQPGDAMNQLGLEEDFAAKQNERRPLEREVSKALRRESDFSSNSLAGSTSREPQRLNKGYRSTLTEIIDLDEASLKPHELSFYDQSAFETQYVSENARGVRVPVNVPGNEEYHNTDHYNVSLSAQVPNAKPLDSVDVNSAKDAENADDWVTEPERYSGLYAEENEAGFLGGEFRRTGSSIANRSDDESLHQVVDNFSSTEHIAQHPAPLGHSGVYRVRELKGPGGGQQMLLPEDNGRQYTVNGFLTNSSRGRPRPSPPKPTEPLSLEHRHPFNNTPPLMPKSPASAWSRGHKRQQAVADRYQFESSDTCSEEGINQAPVPLRQIPSVDPLPLDLTSRSLHLAGRFQATPPATNNINNTSPHLLVVPTQQLPESRPNSFQHVYLLGKGESVPGYNADGTLIALQGSKAGEAAAINNMSNSKYTRLPHDGNGSGSGSGYNNSSPYTPTPKIRSSNKKVNHSPAMGIEMQPLQSTERYQQVQVENKPGWGKGTERLNNPRLFDAVDRMCPNPQPYEDRAAGGYSFRRLGLGRAVDRTPFSPQENIEMDRLRPGLHSLDRRPNYPLSPEMVYRRRRDLSVVVLVLCNLFPPALVLLAAGAFDMVIESWTSGQVTEFGPTQKTIAWTLAAVWLLVIMAGLILFVILFFRD